MPFKVIPVIDILNQTAVHAIKGKREEYKPIKTVLCDSSNPVDLALKFKEVFGFSDLYIADLDSILGKRTNFDIYKQIKQRTGLNLIVDAGMTDFNAMLKSGVSNIAIGTESLQSLDILESLVNQVGRDQVIVSVDLTGRRIKGGSEELSRLNPIIFGKFVRSIGVNKLIILNLERVGTKSGIDFEFIKEFRDKVSLEIFVGGGVRGIQDLLRLKEIEVNGALVATALHEGKINQEDLKLLHDLD